jgi:hypothetical protein
MAILQSKGFFPFCISEAAGVWDGETVFEFAPSMSESEYLPAIGPGSWHPIAMTFQELMEFIYRPAVYRLQATGTARIFDGTDYLDIPNTFNDSGYESGLTLNPVKRQVAVNTYETEASFACREKMQINIQATTASTFDSEDLFEIYLETLAPVQISEIDDEEITTERVYFFEGSYYPFIRVNFQLSYFQRFGIDYFVRSNFVPTSDATQLNLSFLGYNLSIYVANSVWNPEPDEEGLVSFSGNIEVLKWLPYTDDDGNPFYDEDTGVQL